jgi:hypothetical protein
MLFWAKLRTLRERHRVPIVRSIFVVVAAAVVVGWEVDLVQRALIDSGAILLIILALVAEIAITVAQLVGVDYRVSALRDDRESEEHVMKHLRALAPKSADMLEFSGYSVHHLIEQLAHGDAKIRLLMKDPRTTNEFQRRRILSSVEHIQRWISDRYDAPIEIRFYTSAPSLRGRKFDDRFISVGWYTPAIDAKGRDEGTEVKGHCNPSVMCSTTTDEGQRLMAFFDTTFTSLWEASKDNSVESVMKEIERLQEA